MSHVVYALFADANAADEVHAELSRVGNGGPGHDVCHHVRHLDTNQLPEGATTYGWNMAMATIVGSVFFMLAGAIIGAYDVVPGMGPGMGILLGLISGVVIGVYTAMQAGTRIAKAPIQALAPRLPQGAVLLTIEVETRQQADTVIEYVDEHDAEDFGIC